MEFLERYHDYRHYRVGDTYQSNDCDRVKYLQSLGFLGDEVIETSDDDDIDDRLKKLPNGYFELPNGEKVRGKKKAIEALSLLTEGDVNGKQEPGKPSE